MLNRLLAALRREDGTVAESTLSPLLEDVARPIPGQNPCGEDVSYDPDFLRLKEEIDKLNAVDTHVDQEKAAELARQLKGTSSRAGAPAEYGGESNGSNGKRRAPSMDADFVISSALSLLRDKSKDLRLASYLALALARRDGLPGVAEGVGAFAILVDSWWDGLFPPLKRMTGRKNAIEVGMRWLLETLDGVTPEASDREPIEAARAAVSGLTTAFTARELPDLVLQLGVLDAKLAELLVRVPANVPTVIEPVVAPAQPASQPESNGSTPNAASPAIATIPQSAVQASEMIVRAAAWVRQADPRRPTSYRLTRSLRWDSLVTEPPNQQQKTAIEAPPAARRDYLLALHKRGEWADLLREAESSFAQPPFHFWLDLQRLVMAALENLGPEYTTARDAVVREVQGLVARLPGLPALFFADARTRFADAATAAWLEEIARSKPAPAPNARDTAPAARANASLATRFAEPRKRFNDGDLAGALALLQRGASDDASRLDRFLRRLYSATLCLEGGQLSVARALLEELEEDIETHGLDRWDPPLALDVWTRLYACYSAQAGRAGRGDVQQIGRDMQRVFARICRVDTTRALAAAQEVGHFKP